jgi:hypothetical protein
MKIRDLTFVLIRILSLYTIINGLGHLINILQIIYPYYFEDVGPTFNVLGITLLALITGVLLIAIGLFIWSKTSWIASLIVRDHKFNPEDIAAVKESQLYTLGLTLVGTFVFIESLPSVISLIGQLIQLSTTEFAESLGDQRNKVWLQIGVQTFKLALALALVLRTRGIYALVRKIRDIGNEK